MASSAAEIEKKLLEYRRKKELESYIDKSKNAVKKLFKSFTDKKAAPVNIETKPVPQIPDVIYEEEDADNEPLIQENDDTIIDEDPPLFNCSYIDLTFYVLCFVLWVTVYWIFIKLQFGCVYFILSALIGMYFNTRTGPKRKNEVSAYSVFNKNCKSIPGALKAEQFEREIRYGAGAVH